ncbi:hypothetical protein COU18_01105 [Candidatus Kaiserbacteria bacterium CG10_big_fil_rev_8_21_14_0_10_51_14]|uniref:SpaA-like prealbumin fold domain-containing protein n=1 Tax=Candidatus Kaiserbacteria bacterium CG10_big_fil_rev_8_21_14_0_10_51_14 TaxID=1974610 RepID=A0A2H0UC43_9BACT|nr:MAG: hypothetical protein COU18_01105 [Candidatus Kaiserbacteria bacterium CG10_big_fil_rev_8_21_14_0_10_51_14]
MTRTLKLSIAATTLIVVTGLGLFAFSVFADAAALDFESYTLGNIHGQDGWSKTGGYDVEVTSSFGVLGFGTQSLRFSNAVTSGSFGDQTFSKSLVDEAGETTAPNGGFSGGTRQNHFEAEFEIRPMQLSQQPGLFMSVSPDRGDGARMSYLGFSDEADGIKVNFFDVTSVTDPAVFSETIVATGLSRAVTHTAKFEIDFKNGPSNDVVKIYIDGVLVHTGTTWENYYRFDDESNPGLAVNEGRTVDSLLFMARGTAAPTTLGLGYLIDNVELLSSMVVIPPATLVVDDDLACPGATYTTIQAAVDDANPGDTVEVCDGTYDEDVNVNKSIILSGSGIDMAIVQGQGAGEAGALVISADDVEVSGFTVNGTGVSAIRINGARDNISIHDNKAIAATGKNAFLTDGGQSNHTIEENTFEGDASQLVYVNGTASVANASTNVNFVGNTFAGTATGPALGMEADDSMVNHNVFTTSTGYTTIENFGTGNATIRNNIGNPGAGDGFVSAVAVDGTCNWWGDASGPSGVGPGSGEAVGLNVDASTWLTTSDLDGPCDGPLPPAPDVTVTIVKYIDGVHANATSASSLSFPMDASWDAANIGAGSGSFALSTVGFNNPNPYEATTADMTSGADYSAEEDLTGPNVGASCADSKPFALVGYSTGDSEVAAAGNPVSTTTPALTSIATSTYIIVWNETCTTTLTLEKVVVNDNTGTSVDSDWTLFASGPSPISGAEGDVAVTDAVVTPGTYDLSEVGPAGYTASDWVCTGAALQDDSDTVTVGAGEHVICTITNDDDAPPPVPPPPANACATPGTAPLGYTLVNGTTGSDNITIAPFTMFVGKGGNDNVKGPADGNYILCMGTGSDLIVLGNGDFTIQAGNGNNSVTTGNGDGFISAGPGGDRIITGNGMQTINADGGNNVVRTGDGDKTVTTGTGSDQIVTGSGNDDINAGGGTNNVDAGAGDDTITTGTANDTINGGADTDTCNAGGGINSLSNCEL